MHASSALDYFAALRDPLRAPPQMRSRRATATYASLHAAKAAMSDAVYAAALLMATAKRLQQATMNLAADTSMGTLHDFARLQMAQPLWTDFTTSLATAIARYEREWHGQPHPLILLDTAEFANGHVPGWTGTMAVLQKANIHTERTSPVDGATPELDNVGKNTSELIAQHLDFEQQQEHTKNYEAELQSGRSIMMWDEPLVLAAVAAYHKTEDKGLAVLIPQAANLTPDSALYHAAEAFLTAAMTLHDTLITSSSQADRATANRHYQIAKTTLYDNLPSSP